MLKEQAFRLMQIGSSHRSEKEPSILGNLNKLATQNGRREKEKPLIVRNYMQSLLLLPWRTS